MADLLPPNATRFERAAAEAMAPLGAVPIDIAALWNPLTCPMALLPWLAWSLSTDRWDPDWSDDEKRQAVARAIDNQRHKGTRYAVETVLASFDDLLELVEWFEAGGSGIPHTFEVRLPLVDATGAARGTRVSAAFAKAIVADVSRAKPLRAHFTLVQRLDLVGLPAPIVAMQATAYRRLDIAARDADAGTPWLSLLQTEDGEPIEDDSGTTIDGDPA